MNYEDMKETIEVTEEDFEEVVEKELENTPVVAEELSEDNLTMPSVLPKKPLTIQERYIAELYSKGYSSKRIANEMGLPQTTVSRILSTPHIREYVTELVNTQYAVIKEGRLRILNKIVEDKLEQLEEAYDGNLANATKKDIVDVIQAIDSMMKEREKAELGTTQDTYVNIIQQVIKE